MLKWIAKWRYSLVAMFAIFALLAIRFAADDIETVPRAERGGEWLRFWVLWAAASVGSAWLFVLEARKSGRSRDNEANEPKRTLTRDVTLAGGGFGVLLGALSAGSFRAAALGVLGGMLFASSIAFWFLVRSGRIKIGASQRE